MAFFFFLPFAVTRLLVTHMPILSLNSALWHSLKMKLKLFKDCWCLVTQMVCICNEVKNKVEFIF